jgi:hypothetical protein
MNNQKIIDFKNLWIRIKGYIDKIADDFDNQWRKRKRIIGTKFLIAFIFKLVLTRNQQGYGSTLTEMWDVFIEKNMGLGQRKTIVQSSICEARMKLPENVFKRLNSEIINEWEISQGKNILWKNHRIFGIDGSKINLPISFTKLGYGKPGEHSLYPQGLISCLYELKTEIPYDFEMVKHHNERICAIQHLEVLKENDLVVLDRGYFSYQLFLKFIEKKVYVIFRLQRKAGGVFNSFWESDKEEEIITYEPTYQMKRKIIKEDPKCELKAIKLRLIKYTVNNTTYVLATNLFEEKYKINDFKELYHLRWFEEEGYKVIKSIIKAPNFHAKTERGIKQELYAAFNLITIARIFDHKASSQINTGPFNKLHSITKLSSILKINFKNCLMTIARAVEEIIYLSPIKFVNEKLPRMLKSIRSQYQKIRPNRNYPRFSKQIPNKWIKVYKISAKYYNPIATA